MKTDSAKEPHWVAGTWGERSGFARLEVATGDRWDADSQQTERTMKLRLVDPMSGLMIVDILIPASVLGAMLCGGGHFSVATSLFPWDRLGKVAEVVHLLVPHANEDDAKSEAIRYLKLLGDGWSVEGLDVVNNHHRWGRHKGKECVKVIYTRYVDVGTPPVVLHPELADRRVK